MKKYPKRIARNEKHHNRKNNVFLNLSPEESVKFAKALILLMEKTYKDDDRCDELHSETIEYIVSNEYVLNELQSICSDKNINIVITEKTLTRRLLRELRSAIQRDSI